MFWFQVNCDVIFLVGVDSERMGAHSTILMARSRVLFAELCEGWQGKEIQIADVQPEEFACFLRFVFFKKVISVDILCVLFVNVTSVKFKTHAYI